MFSQGSYKHIALHFYTQNYFHAKLVMVQKPAFKPCITLRLMLHKVKDFITWK